jgi:hypothetical protein
MSRAVAKVTRGSLFGRMAVVIFPLLVIPLAAVLLGRAFLPDFLAFGSAPAPTVLAAPHAPPEGAKSSTPTDSGIFGRVLDAEGNPVQGAAVRLVSPSLAFKVLADTTSDGAGVFSFARVGEGGVRVVADRDPGGFASSLPLVDGQRTEVTLVLSSEGAVRGTVVDAEQHPVSGATLSVEWPAWPVPSVTSDEAGNFRISIVPDDATSLVAVARGYETAVAPLGAREERAKVVLKVVLTAGGPVDGEVRDLDDQPVRARVIACEGQPSEARTDSKDDGTFQLPASTLGCSAIADLEGFASSDPASVVDGRRLRLRLKAGGSIEGSVVDERGSGVASYRLGIEAFASARGRRVERGNARRFDDPRGAFHWDKLSPGSYVLTASTAGKPPARSEAIEVKAGEAASGVRIVLAQGGSVIGHVYDDHHAPIADASVRFDAVSSVVEGAGGVKTDEHGSYRLDGAPAGPVSVAVHRDGFRDRLVSGVRVASGRTVTQDISLVVYDGGSGMELGGIGATLRLSDEGIELASVGADDPAGRQGLEVGDRIQRIDGENTEGLSVADVVQRLRGEANTVVGVSIVRPKTGQTLDLMITRGTIVR